MYIHFECGPIFTRYQNLFILTTNRKQWENPWGTMGEPIVTFYYFFMMLILPVIGFI